MLSANEYRILVEQAPIMIWRSDRTGACDYFNERWLAFTGRTAEQERGDGWAAGVHPEDLPRCLEIYRGAFSRRAVFEMEYRLRRADGAYRWLFDRGVPFDDAAGEFAGFIGSCVDVTARVEAERSLARRTKAELRTLEGLLPICAACKKIRDDEGYWQRVEKYVADRSGAEFTHTLCPTCMEVLYPEGGTAP